MELLKNPQRAMKLQVKARGELTAPRIINDDSCAILRGLHDGLNFAAVFPTLPGAFRQEKINRSLVVAITTLKEGIRVEARL